MQRGSDTLNRPFDATFRCLLYRSRSLRRRKGSCRFKCSLLSTCMCDCLQPEGNKICFGQVATPAHNDFRDTLDSIAVTPVCLGRRIRPGWDLCIELVCSNFLLLDSFTVPRTRKAMRDPPLWGPKSKETGSNARTRVLISLLSSACQWLNVAIAILRFGSCKRGSEERLDSTRSPRPIAQITLGGVAEVIHARRQPTTNIFYGGTDLRIIALRLTTFSAIKANAVCSWG